MIVLLAPNLPRPNLVVAAVRALKKEVLFVIPAMVLGQRVIGPLVRMVRLVLRERQRMRHAPGQTKSKPAVVRRIVIGATMELAIVQPALPKATLIQSLARQAKRVLKLIPGTAHLVPMR